MFILRNAFLFTTNNPVLLCKLRNFHRYRDQFQYFVFQVLVSEIVEFQLLPILFRSLPNSAELQIKGLPLPLLLSLPAPFPSSEFSTAMTSMIISFKAKHALSYIIYFCHMRDPLAPGKVRIFNHVKGFGLKIEMNGNLSVGFSPSMNR